MQEFGSELYRYWRAIVPEGEHAPSDAISRFQHGDVQPGQREPARCSQTGDSRSDDYYIWSLGDWFFVSNPGHYSEIVTQHPALGTLVQLTFTGPGD